MIKLFMPFLLVLLTSNNASDDFLKAYGGVPYMGTVQVDIIRPDGTYAKTDYGNSSAHFVSAGNGKVKMVVFGAIKNKNGDAGFAIDGLTRQKTWKSESDSVQLNVSENGIISGNGRNYPQRFTFSGKITANRLELVTSIQSLKASGNGLPAGTTFSFRYVLRRDIAGNSTGKKTCGKIVWRPQYVGNFDGSGTTIRVPRCVNE